MKLFLNSPRTTCNATMTERNPKNLAGMFFSPHAQKLSVRPTAIRLFLSRAPPMLAATEESCIYEKSPISQCNARAGGGV